MASLNIAELLGEELIIDDLKGASKLDVLREFSELLYANRKVEDREGLTRVLAAREALGSTGIGDGVAIPHGKLRQLKGVVLAFGRSKKGVDFDSLDGEPAHLFFLLVAPEDAPGEHLKALARISRLMKDGRLRHSLMQADGRKEIKSLLAGEEARL